MSFTLPLLLPSLSQLDKMSLLDMSEFGEAAPYLRKSYTEQLKLQTIPFDGESPGLPCTAPVCPRACPSAMALRGPPCPFPVLLLKASQALQNSPSSLEGRISLVRKAGF